MPFKNRLNFNSPVNFKVFRKHLALKLISIFMALFIWFLSKRKFEPTRVSFSAPIIFQNFPEKLQIASNFPSTVQLTGMLGRRSGQDFQSKNIQIIIDMERVNPGYFTHTLSEQDVEGASDMEILSLSPSKLEFDIEQVVTKSVTLTPRYHGNLKEGYILQSLEIIPNQAQIEGVQSQVSELTQLFTRSIDLEERSESFIETISLDVPKRIRVLANGSDYLAQVRIKVLPVRRVFKNVQIRVVGSEYEVKINPEVFNVHLEGPKDVLKRLAEEGLSAKIDAEGKAPGSYWERPTIMLPENVMLLQQWPPISLWVKGQQIESL